MTNDPLKDIMKMVIFIALLIAFGFLFFQALIRFDDETSSTYKAKDMMTYAIIFYPDDKTSVEGYVDSFKWPSNANHMMQVVINGEVYIAAPENVVLVQRSNLVINKEDKNEEKPNDLLQE